MRYFIFSFLVLVMATAYVSSTEQGNKKERFLITTGISFTTFTLIKSTTTTTSTTTFTTTCTTSTSTLKTCTTAKRRRRGLFYDETPEQVRHRRAGLFYIDDEMENTDGASFLPVDKKTSDPVEEVLPKTVSEDGLIPLEIQPGFSVPEGTEANRFLLTFGVATRTSIVFSTATVSLTAICLSTSGFPVCGGVGK